MTAHQVEMITHYRAQGMTQAQIGHALRIPRSTVGRIPVSYTHLTLPTKA